MIVLRSLLATISSLVRQTLMLIPTSPGPCRRPVFRRVSSRTGCFAERRSARLRSPAVGVPGDAFSCSGGAVAGAAGGGRSSFSPNGGGLPCGVPDSPSASLAAAPTGAVFRSLSSSSLLRFATGGIASAGIRIVQFPFTRARHAIGRRPNHWPTIRSKLTSVRSVALPRCERNSCRAMACRSRYAFTPAPCVGWPVSNHLY